MTDEVRLPPDLAKLDAEPRTTVIPCRNCREPIDPAARYCKHCKSDLTWRRHVMFSSTTLALVTALLAVAGTVGPTIKDLLKPRGAQLAADVIGSDGRAVVLLLQNTGDSPAGVSRAQLRFGTNDGRTIIVDLQAIDGAAVVEPGKALPARFFYHFGTLKPEKYVESTTKPSLECDLTIDGVSGGKALSWGAKNRQCMAPLLDFHLSVEEMIKEGRLNMELPKGK